jgi:type II secretory pathway pseudopilin PulG
VVRRGHHGFTYLAVLFIVAILSGGLALTGEVWETTAKREKEAELLFIGHQYRKAIERYYLSVPQRRYPPSLEALLKDARVPGTARYLRKLYPDPLTGKEWGLAKAPDGGIWGVFSQSAEKPLKVGGFKLQDAGFERAQTYADWKFIHTLAAQAGTGAPPAPPKPVAK